MSCLSKMQKGMLFIMCQYHLQSDACRNLFSLDQEEQHVAFAGVADGQRALSFHVASLDEGVI